MMLSSVRGAVRHWMTAYATSKLLWIKIGTSVQRVALRMFKRPLLVLTAAISSRLPPLNQRQSSVLPFGAAYVEDAELVRVGQSLGSTAAATCTKPRFSLPAAQVIQLTQLQTVRQTA